MRRLCITTILLNIHLLVTYGDLQNTIESVATNNTLSTRLKHILLVANSTGPSQSLLGRAESFPSCSHAISARKHVIHLRRHPRIEPTWMETTLRSPRLNSHLARAGTMAHEASSFTSIPVLDFSQTASQATRPQFLAELRNAIVNVGFFYLKNGPVSRQTQEAFIAKSMELFDLPLKKKSDIEMVNSKHFLGYSRLGAEITAQKQDFREQFDVSKT